jgi:hypothetical protein
MLDGKMRAFSQESIGAVQRDGRPKGWTNVSAVEAPVCQNLSARLERRLSRRRADLPNRKRKSSGPGSA